IKLSDTVVRLFELKVPLPAKSNSTKVRDSPHAVGVRVSTLRRVSRGLCEKEPLPREVAVLCGTKFPGVGKPETVFPEELSGAVSKLPVTPTVVVWLPFGWPPTK